MLKKIIPVIIVLCLFLGTFSVFADDTEDLQTKVSELETRIAILEKMILDGAGTEANVLPSVIIPDISGMEKDDAILVTSTRNLIPVFSYEYSDTVAEGTVIYTDPTAGTEVESDSKITIGISKGPSHIDSLGVAFRWDNVGYTSDDWNNRVGKPYIEEEYLYIDVHPLFGSSFSFKEGPFEDNDNLIGFGYASLNDTFDKMSPVYIYGDGSTVTAGQEKELTLKTSLTQLDTERPTDLYIRMILEDGTSVEVLFIIEWGD